MNKTFKTIWNDARRSYIVTNEAQKSHGKPSKSAVALAVVATAFLSMGAANAAYVDPGFVATSASNLSSAVASWETDEYKADWGLTAMNASKAYALGFHGQDLAVGVMDSGALLQKHPDLAGDRFHASSASSEYGSTGERYPQQSESQGHGDYAAGEFATESGTIDGNWIMGTNDSHGTHVTGTVGGNRDGSEFHGVSWGSDVWVGNTGGTDNTNYGPFQDYKFFNSVWSALAQDLIKANGAERGGVINNSFGTNTRIVDNGTKGADGGNTGVHFPTDTVAQTEYEFFLFNNRYINKENAGKDVTDWSYSFVDAAWQAVKGTKVVQVFTTGNRDFANPFYRPLYPYFNPEAEKNWVAVAGMKQDGNGGYTLYDTFNEAGNAKWWTVAAPGSNIYSSKVDTATGEPLWGNSSGTSMAAPHVTGAMAVLMSRYPDMDATQIRDVLFTTASHTNPDGTVYEGWTAKEGEVDVRYGWGMPDLDKGMYGLGQLFGSFNYNMANSKLDVWSNDISQVAWDQRLTEEANYKAVAEKWQSMSKEDKLTMKGLSAEEKALIGDWSEYTLVEKDGKQYFDTDVDIVGLTDAEELVSVDDAIEWKDAYIQERLDAIAEHTADAKASLTKAGEGTLVLLGKNSYKGDTVVEGGKLLAFSESIGNRVVNVNGGSFGVLSSYNDTFTMTGVNHSEATDADKLTINLNGGKLFVDAGSNVNVKTVSGITGAESVEVGLASAGTDTLAAAYKGEETISGSITADDASFANLKDQKLTALETDSAFFKVSDKSTVSEDGKTLGVSVESNGKTIADFATSKNSMAIATALENGPANDFMGSVLAMNEAAVKDTLSALSDDMYSTARNAFTVNSLTVSRTVVEQARSYGEGRAEEFANGQGRIWLTGVGQWMNADGVSSSMDVDFAAGIVGAEWIATENTKFGAYFGYGKTKYRGNTGKIDGDDLHYGIYGMSDIGSVSLTYGVGYTTEDRDSSRQFWGAQNSHSEDATALQVFAEAAYNDLYVGTVNVAPYFGYSWLRIETDGFTESAQGTNFRMQDTEDDVHVATVGARVTAPVMVGKMPVALKADVGYSRFFGDTESVTRMQLGNGGAIASIEGEELEGQVNFGLGVTAQIGKRATLGVSYTGAYGSDTDTHGIGANLRFNF